MEIGALKGVGPKTEKILKNYAKSININQFNLFSGWYYNLSNCDIYDFYDFIIGNAAG